MQRLSQPISPFAIFAACRSRSFVRRRSKRRANLAIFLQLVRLSLSWGILSWSTCGQSAVASYTLHCEMHENRQSSIEGCGIDDRLRCLDADRSCSKAYYR